MSEAPPPDWRQALLVHAAVATGLLEAHRAPATPDQAAAATGLDPRGTGIVVRALAGRGVLEPAGAGAHVLTGWGRRLADPPPSPEMDATAALLLEARALINHARLEDLLRGGVPDDDVSEGDAATRLRFMRAMRLVAAPRVPHTVEALGAPWGGARLLDIGGAPGSYARGFAAAGWRVTVMDLPWTLAVGAAELAAAGVATVPGDATQAIPAGPWEVIYLGNLVHLLDPGEAAALILRCAGALTADGVLAVQEVLGDRSPQGPDFGLMMLASTRGGDAYPEAAYRDWLAAAGMEVADVVELEEGAHHLLIGRRA
ncbi:MAG: methyltransferase [Miltoncostaeaceae bacterium]